MAKRRVDWQFVSVWTLVMAVLGLAIYLAVTRLPGRTSASRKRARQPAIPHGVPVPPRTPPQAPPPIEPR